MANSMRCSICGISFPYEKRFEVCTECGEKTAPIQAPPTISLDEAVRLLRNAEFQKYLAQEGRE